MVFFLGLAVLATRPLITDLGGHTIAGGDPATFGSGAFWPPHHGLLNLGSRVFEIRR